MNAYQLQWLCAADACVCVLAPRLLAHTGQRVFVGVGVITQPPHEVAAASCVLSGWHLEARRCREYQGLPVCVL